MGIRNLAYEIKKCKRGYYYVIYFKADGSLIAELERNYRINEEVIRFIVINYKSKTEQKNWGVLVDKANGKYIEPPKKKKGTESSAEANAENAESKENAESSGDSAEGAVDSANSSLEGAGDV